MIWLIIFIIPYFFIELYMVPSSSMYTSNAQNIPAIYNIISTNIVYISIIFTNLGFLFYKSPRPKSSPLSPLLAEGLSNSAVALRLASSFISSSI